MLKKQKGITLIALIITIIVMLILVGVTINVALNGGLFEKTETATKETEEKEILEEMLTMMEVDDNGKFDYDTIISNMEAKHPEYAIEYSYPNATITGKLGTYNYIVSETELKIGKSDNSLNGSDLIIEYYIPEHNSAIYEINYNDKTVSLYFVDGETLSKGFTEYNALSLNEEEIILESVGDFENFKIRKGVTRITLFEDELLYIQDGALYGEGLESDEIPYLITDPKIVIEINAKIKTISQTDE